MDDLQKFKYKILRDKDRIKKEEKFIVIKKENKVQRIFRIIKGKLLTIFRIIKDEFLYFLYKIKIYK